MGSGYIIDYEYSAGTFVVDFAQRFVSLLSCSIPEGDFDVLAANLYYFGEKLYSNSCFLTLVELIAYVAGSDIGLACAGWANDDNFEHLVVVVH